MFTVIDNEERKLIFLANQKHILYSSEQHFNYVLMNGVFKF